MSFPARRMRRLRRTPVLRRLVAETRLSVDDLVLHTQVVVRDSGRQPRDEGWLGAQHRWTVASLEASHAAVELAVISTFLVPLFVLTLDFARLFYYQVTIDNCARNGALYGARLRSYQETAGVSPYNLIETYAALAIVPRKGVRDARRRDRLRVAV